MFERILAAVAAFATIAAFILEVWREWQRYRTDNRKPNDARTKKNR